MADPPLSRGGTLKFQPKKISRRPEAVRAANSQEIDRARQEQQQRAQTASASTHYATTFPRGRGYRNRNVAPSIHRPAMTGTAGPLSGPSPVIALTSGANVGRTQATSSHSTFGAAVNPATSAPAETKRGRGRGRGSAAPVHNSVGTTRGSRRPVDLESSKFQDSQHAEGVPRGEAKDHSSDGALSISDYWDSSDEDVKARDYHGLDNVSDSSNYDSDEPRLRPLPILRDEHRDRIKTVNTEATTDASARLRLNAFKAQKSSQLEQSMQNNAHAGQLPTKIKVEKNNEHEEPSDNEWEETRTGTATDIEMEFDGSPADSISLEPQELEPIALEPSTVPQQTEEERDEEVRLETGQRCLIDELGPLRGSLSDHTEMSGPKATVRSSRQHPRERNVFVFQLPPILPDLVYTSPEAQAKISTTPSNSGVLRSSSRKKSKDKQRATVAFTEPGEQYSHTAKEGALKTSAAATGASFAAPDMPAFSGRVGTLRVLANGTAQLNWGGITCDLQRGCVGELLQDVVIVGGQKDRTQAKVADVHEEIGANNDSTIGGGEKSDAENENDGTSEIDTSAVAVGQPIASYVATPAWGRLLAKAAS